jgi:hypothetical protein
MDFQPNRSPAITLTSNPTEGRNETGFAEFQILSYSELLSSVVEVSNGGK